MSNKKQPKQQITKTLLVTRDPNVIWQCPDCDSVAYPSNTGADYNIAHDDTCPFLARMQQAPRGTIMR